MSRIVTALIAVLITAATFTLHLPAVIAPNAAAATFTATVTNTPTFTSEPSGNTATPTSTATDTPTPTATETTSADTDTPTATPTVADTPTVTPTPTSTTQAQGPCSCTGDLYNCTSFATHSQAQACFDFCESQGAGDVHHLDSDGDGNACESLPGNFQIVPPN